MAECVYKGHQPGTDSPQLTEEALNKILGYIRAGNYIQTAVAAAGFNQQQSKDWSRKGRQAVMKSEVHGHPINDYERLCIRFYRELAVAVADAERIDLERVTAAGERDWKAAAWKLERKYNAHWGYVHRQEIKNLSKDLTDKIDKLSDKELVQQTKDLLAKVEKEALREAELAQKSDYKKMAREREKNKKLANELIGQTEPTE